MVFKSNPISKHNQTCSQLLYLQNDSCINDSMWQPFLIIGFFKSNLDNKKMKLINDLHRKYYHAFFKSLKIVCFQTIPSSKIWSVSALISRVCYFLVLTFEFDDVYIAYFLSDRNWTLAMLTAKFSTMSTIQNQHHI